MVPGEATLAARSGWTALSAGAHSPGTWQLIGPSKATYPAVLTAVPGRRSPVRRERPRHGDGPRADLHPERLRSVRRGGGRRRLATDKALTGSNWQFVSGGFGINAIGGLLLDPSDPTGNTVYAGTGEPNASGDSEAGVGVYKTTDGGQTWTLVPGSDIFFQRAIGQMAFDNDGNLLVTVASAVRGIRQVSSGAGVERQHGCHSACVARPLPLQ